MNREFPDVQAGFIKGIGTRDQIANICWIIEKAREFQKNILSRQVSCSGLPFPLPGDLPDPEIEPGSPALHADSLPSEPLGKPHNNTMGEKSQNGFELITFKSGGSKGENHPEGVNGLTNTFFFFFKESQFIAINGFSFPSNPRREVVQDSCSYFSNEETGIQKAYVA